MSIVTLQVGQCGNQIGKEFFSTIAQDISSVKSKVKSENCYSEDSKKRFFCCEEDEKHDHARAILIDTERKVVNNVMQNAKREGNFCYSADNVYLQSRGSANNWAYGFNQEDTSAIDQTMKLCRLELERCDRLDGFLVMMSSAGGTGSGLGTRITSELCEHFPKKFILNQVVLPHRSGEVVLQDYNTILTLCHLYQSSDGIMLFENDRLFKICKSSLGHQQNQIALKDLNEIVATQMCSILQPSLDHGESESHGPARWPSTMADLLDCLCYHPQYKLMSVTNSPCSNKESRVFDSFLWPGLLKDLRQNTTMSLISQGLTNSKDELPLSNTTNQPSESSNKSFAHLAILRGTDLHQTNVGQYFPKKFYTTRNRRNCLSTWKQARPLLRYDKYATLVSNDQSHVQSLNSIVAKAWKMFSARAYVHQYLQCGLSEEEFIYSFAAVEQIIHDYCNL